MTTGKHSDLQTLQNSDGTFELVVASDGADEWSEVDQLPQPPQKQPWFARIPWKSVVIGTAALLVVAGIVSMVVEELRSGVTISDEPLPVVAGFKPYTGGASAGLGSGKRSPGSRAPVVEDDEWTDEEEPREIVVEKGEPAPVEVPEPTAVVADGMEETIVENDGVTQPGHDVEPSGLQNLARDPTQIQQNLNRQLRTVSGQPLGVPMNRPNFGAVFGENQAPSTEPQPGIDEIPVEGGVGEVVGENPEDPQDEPSVEIDQENN